MPVRELHVQKVEWPLKTVFRISRGAKQKAEAVRVRIHEDGYQGQGEAVPYPRYGQTVDSSREEIERVCDALKDGANRSDIQAMMSPGAARNAVDCALWDLESKMARVPVWKLAGLPQPVDMDTAFTISLDSPDAMGRDAAIHTALPILKVKLDDQLIVERLRAVRNAAPTARLVIDANEAWTIDTLVDLTDEFISCGVEMIEQPLPAEQDQALAGLHYPVALCADESCHGVHALDLLAGRYDMINIKLDKTGGLTEALELRRKAREHGFQIMVGCMVSSSLAIAPACLVAQDAAVIDLDAPLFLTNDHRDGIVFDGATIRADSIGTLWGG